MWIRMAMARFPDTDKVIVFCRINLITSRIYDIGPGCPISVGINNKQYNSNNNSETTKPTIIKHLVCFRHTSKNSIDIYLMLRTTLLWGAGIPVYKGNWGTVVIRLSVPTESQPLPSFWGQGMSKELRTVMLGFPF